MVLAHAGDWFASLLYAAPVLIIVVALLVQSRRGRSRKQDEHVASPQAGEWTPKTSSEPPTSSSA